MKEFLTKTLILVFGLGVATTFMACHSGGGESAPVVAPIAPKHSISGTILKADGSALNGATVKINGVAVAVTGNTFAKGNLADGEYVIEVSHADYKTVTTSENLAVQTVRNEKVGVNLEKTFYLYEDASTEPLSFGAAQATDEITIETTDQKDADGEKTNDTDESITVFAESPLIEGDDYDNINNQIKAQSSNTKDITSFTITLTNITSLEDAKAVAKANRVADSRITRATTAMPDENELLAGVAVNAGTYAITMPAEKPFVVTVNMPNDVKGAVTLYRTITGDQWTKIDKNNLPADILAYDDSQEGVIKLSLGTVKTQSFGFGVKVVEETVGTDFENVEPQTKVNTTNSWVSVSSMPYTVKAGVVLGQVNKSSLTDFLRKLMVRKYGTLIVKSAKIIQKTYIFSPAYSMHPNGVLYLEGFQLVDVVKYSVKDSNASYTCTVYGDAYVFTYEEYTEPEEIYVHGGGSN